MTTQPLLVFLSAIMICVLAVVAVAAPSVALLAGVVWVIMAVGRRRTAQRAHADAVARHKRLYGF